MPRRVDAQPIGRSDARSRPATESHGGNAAGPEIHTTAGTRSWGPRTNPSTRCRPRDFEETSSILGMADAFLRHVLGNGGLPDIDAELEQFAMNPRCTPKRVLNTHVSNELTNLQRSLWSATARSRFPPPIGSESGPVPTDHRLRFENFQGIQHARNKTIQPSKHQAIDALEGRSFGRLALQDVELMAQNNDLRLKPCPRSEEPGQHACQQHEKIDHRARTSPDSPSAR